jgi:general secretion pathway protein G
VPGFGFILGAAAVTWGLLSDRPRSGLAIGLGASGAFLNLVGVVAFTVILRDNPMMVEARQAAARQDLVTVVLALERFRGTRGRYPRRLEELTTPVPVALVNVYDNTAGGLVPRPYQYERSADSGSYDLFAVGSDGKPGTSDDIRPQIPDSLLSQVGYRPASP